ncbi:MULTISPECIES: hypothetical protein [Methanosarcina]|nr:MULTISPECIES: hypothetical protein [Methanosarcina]
MAIDACICASVSPSTGFAPSISRRRDVFPSYWRWCSSSAE